LSGFLHQRASDGQIDYEQFIRSARDSRRRRRGARECFRRAVFNLLTTNRDDHGRNHAFLYNETDRTWTLSPAYDLNPNVANVLIALTWLGSPEIPTRFEQLTRLAEIGGIPARAAKNDLWGSRGGHARRLARRFRLRRCPEKIADIWEKEMSPANQAAARGRTATRWQTAKPRPATPKRSPQN